jgi:hypothetical protein
MDNGLMEQRVICSRCRFRLSVQVPESGDWRIDAQCPSCESWACFTLADTRDPPVPDSGQVDAAAQGLGEQLWQPIKEHRGHPALAWMDRIGNGVFEDDHSESCWPVPSWIYRFTRQAQAAYVWQEASSWFVRSWHPLRGERKPPDAAEVFSFAQALDHLLD